LQIFNSILEEDKTNNNNNNNNLKLNIENKNNFYLEWTVKLDTIIKSLNSHQIDKIILFLKDWNTNSKNCFICQIILNSFLRIIKTENLLNNFKNFNETNLKGLLAYSERHFQRLEKLHQETYMIEYITSMIHLLPKLENNGDKIENNVKKNASMNKEKKRNANNENNSNIVKSNVKRLKNM
jgi:hypothetical protein